MSELSRNAQVLKYFTQQRQSIPSTILLKLAYLADLEARKYFRRPISSFDWQYHTYGPFDKAFYAALDELRRADLIRQTEDRWGNYVAKPVYDCGDSVPFEFTAAETQILDWVVRTYRSSAVGQFLEEIVYETEPMKQAERGQAVPMELVDGTESERVSVDFDAVFVAADEATQGSCQPLDEVFDELQAGRTG